MGKIFAVGFVLVLLSIGIFGATISEREGIDDGRFDSTWSSPDGVSGFGSQHQLLQPYVFLVDDGDDDEDEGKEEDDHDEDDDEKEGKEKDDDDDEDDDENEGKEKDDDDDEDEDEKGKEKDNDDDEDEDEKGKEKDDDDDEDEDEKGKEKGGDDDEDENEKGKERGKSGQAPAAVPPTPSSTPTATSTPTPSSTPSATPTPTPSSTPSATPTPTPSSAPSAISTANPTSAPSTTATPTVTPSDARFTVVTATLDATQITAGEAVQVTLQVANAGERNGTFSANLTVDAGTVDSKSVTIEPGESETMVFEYRFDQPGEYDVAVANTSVGVVVVTAPSDRGTTTPQHDDDADGPGGIEVIDATIPADWVRIGHETVVRATVVNTGNRRATRTLTVTVDDDPVAITSVTLYPSEADVVEIRTEIHFEVANGTVAVEGVEAGSITVSGRYGEVRIKSDDTADEGWGFGFGTPVLLILLTILAGGAALLSKR